MKWYYLGETSEVAGPVTEEALREMLDSGSLSETSQICREGTEGWIELKDALELFPQWQGSKSQSRPGESPVGDGVTRGLRSRPANGPASVGATRTPKPDRNRTGWAVGGALGILLTVGAVVCAVFSGQESSDQSTADDFGEQRKDIQEQTIEDPKNPTSAEGQWFLGHQYHQGWDGIPQDFLEAEKWFRKSALQGHKMAQASLGQMYLKGEGVDIDYEESARWWRYAAEQGLPIAQHKMGVFYLSGLAGEQDSKLAYMWLNLAASGDDDEIASEARELRTELGTQMESSDLKEAQRLSQDWSPKLFADLDLSSDVEIEQSAEEDTKAASTDTDLREYYKGLGFSDEEATAILKYFDNKLKAADAMANLAALYEGRDMWDADKVMHWNYKAAEAGSRDAMYRLAVIFHPGFALAYRGYPEGDAEQSHNWLEKAAEAGNPEALNGMGTALWHGVKDNDGVEFLVEPNKQKAVKWWRDAAGAGSSDAVGNLTKYQVEIASLEDVAISEPKRSTANDKHPPSIKILSASYGVGKKRADVTEKVKQYIEVEKRGFRVAAKAMGVDPAPRRKKSIQIQYVVDGQTFAPWWSRNELVSPATLVERAEERMQARNSGSLPK